MPQQGRYFDSVAGVFEVQKLVFEGIYFKMVLHPLLGVEVVEIKLQSLIGLRLNSYHEMLGLGDSVCGGVDGYGFVDD